MNKITKCVIPIAGRGTRLLPITKTISKEMLPIVDVPTIYLQVMEAYLSGIREIIFIVIDYNINLIKNYFNKDYLLEEFLKNDSNKLNELKSLYNIIDHVKFTYIMQEGLGTYSAIYSARKYLNNEYFAVIYGDDLIDSKKNVLQEMINLSIKENSMIMLVKETNYKELPSFGIVQYKDNNTIKELVSNNKNNNRNQDVVYGRFIVHTNIFNIKDKLIYHKNNELHLPESMLLTDTVKAYKLIGNYYNIGSKLGYLKANIAYYLKREDKNLLIEYMKNIINEKE